MSVYCRRAEIKVNDNNVVGGKSEIQLESWSFLEKGKKRVRRFDLIIKLHKDGSILESRIEEFNLKLQALFGKIISKVNSEKNFMK